MKIPFIKIEFVGRVKVISATLVSEGEHHAIISLHFESKGVEVLFSGTNNGIPAVDLVLGKDTDEDGKIGMTEVVFPRYAGFSVVSESVSRYNGFITLVDMSAFKSPYTMEHEEFEV